MSELTPITRVESYLDAIVNNGIPPTEDITRIETFLQAIYDNQVCQLTPITRIEMFLGKISGQDIVLPEPITRVEMYLAAIAGEDAELPETPITRLEMYLAEWADSGDWTTISGAIVEFITQRAHKLKSCVVTLEPQQDLSHGDPSPTNICPISGWTGCEVTRTGKNLLNIDDIASIPVGSISRNGFYFRKAGTYTVSAQNSANDYMYCRIFNSDGTAKTTYNIVSGSTISPATFTVQGGEFFAVYDAMEGTIAISKARFETWECQVELNNEPTAYEPYNGNSYSITWEDEVYGANPDIVSGEMPVTYAEVDLGSLSWALFNNNATRQAWALRNALSNMKPLVDGDTPLNAFCPIAKSVSYNATWKPYTFSVNSVGTKILIFCVNPSEYATAEEFQAAMSGVKFVYERATPVETTITPTPITALKGYNAMWSNAGDIEVTVHGTPVEVETLQALNMLLGGAYRNSQTQEDVSDNEALDILLGGADR